MTSPAASSWTPPGATDPVATTEFASIDHRNTEKKVYSNGVADKAKNAAQDAVRKAKEAAGEAKNDDSLKAEGKSDQTKAASTKKAGENVKDVFKR